MKLDKLVSIIMPVLNNEKYLDESIKSILNQSYKNIELLILDDGSKDKSLSIIERYAIENKNIRIISRDNKGVSNSICEMIKFANGDYIGRMDGDDVSYENRIETQIKFLEGHGDVSLVGSYVDVEIVDYKNNSDKEMCERIFNFKVDKYAPSVKILNKNMICHGTFLARAKLFQKINYDCKLKECEDIDVILNCIDKGLKVEVINKRLYLNRVCSKFVHRQKGFDDCYNKEILECKFKFLEKYLQGREIYILGDDKRTKIFSKIINNKNKYNFQNIIFKVDEIKDLKNSYILILDQHHYENFEHELQSKGRKILNDFITL